MDIGLNTTDACWKELVSRFQQMIVVFGCAVELANSDFWLNLSCQDMDSVLVLPAS